MSSAVNENNKNQGITSLSSSVTTLGEIIYMGLKRPDEPALMEDYLFAYDQPGAVII